jgi:hypothetical protein
MDFKFVVWNKGIHDGRKTKKQTRVFTDRTQMIVMPHKGDVCLTGEMRDKVFPNGKHRNYLFCGQSYKHHPYWKEFEFETSKPYDDGNGPYGVVKYQWSPQVLFVVSNDDKFYKVKRVVYYEETLDATFRNKAAMDADDASYRIPSRRCVVLPKDDIQKDRKKIIKHERKRWRNHDIPRTIHNQNDPEMWDVYDEPHYSVITAFYTAAIIEESWMKWGDYDILVSDGLIKGTGYGPGDDTWDTYSPHKDQIVKKGDSSAFYQSIIEKLYHPDRVERMTKVYGEIWADIHLPC